MQLEQKLNQLKNKVGLVSGSLRINEYDDVEEDISAHINPKGWYIEINLKKGFNPVEDEEQKRYAKNKNIRDGKEALLHDLLIHELAHWELPFNSGLGCPFDTYNHDLILESVKKALPENKKSLADYVANAFEDVMINPRCKEFEGGFEGQMLFWDNQGLKAKKHGQKSYTPFYEAFVKLNWHLFGDKQDFALLKRHFSKNKDINKVVKKTIRELSLERNHDSSKLFNKAEWPEMAAIFTNNLAELLDVSPTEKLSAGGGNGLEEKAKTREGKEEVAYGRYSNGKRLSPNIQSYEQLDLLYRKLARSIPVRVEAMTKEHSMEISPLNYRPFDEEKDDVRKAKPSKLYFRENGFTIGYQKQPITITERSKVQRRSFPDFKMVVLDNSGSMKEGIDGNAGNKTYIPWGDNSKYHYALLGFYGIENFLQSQGIAQYIGHGLSLFSSTTRYKESGFVDVYELRKLALSPEFGSTQLDAKTLLDALKGRKSFVLSISDGEIANWDSAKSEFENLARENYFAHIQIGRNNQFTKDLESEGFPVFYVSSGNELSKLMVNIASDTYRRFVRT